MLSVFERSSIRDLILKIISKFIFSFFFARYRVENLGKYDHFPWKIKRFDILMEIPLNFPKLNQTKPNAFLKIASVFDLFPS